MDRQTTSKFLFAVSPLVFGHVLIPPLSYFYGERMNPSSPLSTAFKFFYNFITPSRLLCVDNVLALTLDPGKDYNAERLTPWFTHIFVHSTYEHMLLNLQSLLVTGYPVFNALGTGPMFALFLLGGAVADMPSALHASQPKGTLPGTGLLPPFLRKGLHSVLSFFQLHREVHCGSSGGIMALMGGGGALQGLRMARLLLACHRGGMDALCAHQSGGQYTGGVHYSCSNRNSSRSNNNSNSNRSPTALSTSGSLLLYLRHAARRLCTFETFHATTQIVSQYLTISLEVAYLSSETSSNVNYAAHVQGYLFGIISTVSFLLIQQQKRISYGR